MTDPDELATNGSSSEGQQRRAQVETEQVVSDADQTAADAEQTAADTDEISADHDQAASERDQRLSDADQRSSDRDQAIADAETAPDQEGDVLAAWQRERDILRDQRAEATIARAETAALRAEIAIARFDAADQRDEAARARDLASAARDLAARARDRLLSQNERGPAAIARKRAADDRVRAAEDRRLAAEDREQARADREELRHALTEAHFDDLTGTFRRTLGKVALQREVDRAHRLGGHLVLAFVDVDGLKAYNDRDGHDAGDELLVEVVATIRANLRSYDPVVRFGGDEFVCALAGADMADAQTRFDGISSALAPRGSVSVGLAEIIEGDTLESLVARGDAALYEAKLRRWAS